MSQKERPATNDHVIRLGLDPSTKKTGWAILEGEALIVKGIIRPRYANRPIRRAESIYYQIEHILQIYKPSEVACENSFTGQNKVTAMKLSEVRGVIMLAIARAGIPHLTIFQPSTLKLVLTGRGDAAKAEMIESARKRYNLQSLEEDEADAIACALSLIHRPESGKRIS